jgi:murein DD-endopeptidase MepM/ murein hydrolase activator NlpD
MRYIKSFLVSKIFIRSLLIAAILHYLPLPVTQILTFPFAAWRSARNAAAEIVAETAYGIGGGLVLADQSADELAQQSIDQSIDHSIVHSISPMLTYTSYTLQSGDIIGNIARWAGLNEDTLISANNVQNTRRLQIGQVIRIPNQDGIFYSVRPGDTLEGIAARHNSSVERISAANELFSDSIAVNASLFIPGARMDWVSRQEINGDLFIWPVTGRLSSPYGWRLSPFTRVRQFHSGIDIAAPTGTPVRAAMAGRVAQVGYNNVWGNFIMINHHSGYRTFYAHLSVVRARTGAFVSTGERIGDVGSSGQSTGPHLHFTVYRNGITVNPRTLMR